MRINTTFLTAATRVILFSLIASLGWAQDSRDQSNRTLEEIVVTAQKRTQNLQEVPIGITVLDEDTIEGARIQNIADVAQQTPNFYFDGVTPEASTLTIRGVGSIARLGQAGFDPSVIVYVDEVYIGRTGGSVFDLFDLERIEVLRGPQGTLFGRNAVGGVVHVVTKKPVDARYAKLQTTFGNYAAMETKGVFNGRLADDLLAKISFSTRDRDGVNNNVHTGNEIDDINSRSARGQLKYIPSDDLQVLMTAEYARDEIDGFGKRPTIPAGVFSTSVIGFVPAAGFRDFQNSIDGFFDRDIYGLSGHIDWQTDFGTINSISAWRVVDFALDNDTAGAPGGPDFATEPTLDDTVPGFLSRPSSAERVETFTQEFRLSSGPEGSKAFGLAGKLDWTIGGYFLREVTDRKQDFRRVLNIIGAPISSSHVLFDQNNETDSAAIFGQITYELTDGLEATLGARQTWDTKKLALEVSDLDPNNLNTNSLAPAIEEFAVVSEETFNAFTPKATLSYFPKFGRAQSRSVMFYASVSEGFKSGGFDGLAGAALGASAPFAQEEARNYEVGIRSRLFDNRIQLNATAFRIDFDNLQLFERVLTVPGDQASATVLVVNAEEAQIDGIELDLVLRPFSSGFLSGLTLLGNVGLQDSELTNAALKSVLPGLDRDGLLPAEGQRLPRAPEVNYFISGEYEFQLGNGNLIFRLSDRYTGDIFFELGEPSPGGFQESYHLVDSSITYIPDEAGNWEFRLWAKNIFDEEYYVSQQAVSGGATALGVIGEPLTYGLTISWNWEE